MARYLWITYAWADNVEGDFDYIVSQLHESGIEVKFDRIALVPGQRLWDQIADQINSKELLGWAYLVTPQSLASEPCREELAYALDRTLSSKGLQFPLIGMIHQAPFSSLPPALKTRLCVPLTAPDWVEQVRAGIEARPPVSTISNTDLEPFRLRIHGSYGGSNNLKAIEIQPRIGEFRHWRFAFPANGLQPYIVGTGSPNGGTVSSSARDFVSGTIEVNKQQLIFSGAGDSISPATTAYAVFAGDIPDLFGFGIARGPLDLSHGWRIYQKGPNSI